jgi:hypothetical protein
VMDAEEALQGRATGELRGLVGHWARKSQQMTVFCS